MVTKKTPKSFENMLKKKSVTKYFSGLGLLPTLCSLAFFALFFRKYLYEI